MKKVAHIILENELGELLLYLRDDKPEIPFPNHWDLIGGHVEENESVEEALIREIKEEINLDFKQPIFWKSFVCLEGDVYPNIKYVYRGTINIPIQDIVLSEGQKIGFFNKEQINELNFANIHKEIVNDYVKQFGYRLI